MQDVDDAVRETFHLAEDLLPRAVKGLRKLVREGATLTDDDCWAGADTEELRAWDSRAAVAIDAANQFSIRFRELFDAGGKHCVQHPFETPRLLGQLGDIGDTLREQTFASEMRLRLADTTGGSIDRALVDWRIEQTTAHADALGHVLTRRPKEGPDARWRVIMRRSSPQRFYRWIKASVVGTARDEARPGRKPRLASVDLGPQAVAAAQSVELLALAERAGWSRREVEITAAISVGDTCAAAARRLGIKPSTARVHFKNAKDKAIRVSRER